MELREFRGEDIPRAAALLARRHREQRLAFPMLRKAFEESAGAERALRELLEDDGAQGVCAYDGQRLLGYIVAQIDADDAGEKCAAIPYAGMAVAQTQPPALYGRLYAALSGGLLRAGALRHYAVVPAGGGDAVDAWLRLGFAFEQVMGMAALEDITSHTPQRPLPPGLILRPAEADDSDALREISGLISRYQACAPVYAYASPERYARIRQAFGELPGDESALTLLAVNGQGLAGFLCAYTDAEDTDLLAPENGVEIAVCGVPEACRGQGIGGRLTRRAAALAMEKRFENALTDWRITNPLASAFWPARGFRPVAYRMHRALDARFAPQE